MKQYEADRIKQRHQINSALDWRQIKELYTRGLGFNLYASCSALMLHRLARMRSQNMKRKRRKVEMTEQLHAPKPFVLKWVLCLQC